MTSRAVVLLTGPSGSGKSRLGRDSGLPMLSLDDFYKDGDNPTAPRHPELGIVDWDDPRSWDADAAVAALRTICEQGRAEVPVYDIAHDRAASTQTFDCGGSPVFIAEGIFAAELVASCKASGMLADAIVVRRRMWKNFLRRLVRDLREGRKSPTTLVRRGWLLMRREPEIVARQVALGARACDAGQTREALRRAARRMARHS
ncbi:MAG: hypothetical protein ABWZ26_07880 [Candidatus Nanopelagicales bacterium]